MLMCVVDLSCLFSRIRQIGLGCQVVNTEGEKMATLCIYNSFWPEKK